MIEIGINPNTKIASVAITLRGYFGLNKDGIKLVDQDTVFEAETVKKAGEIPTESFTLLKPEPQSDGHLMGKDPVTGQFQKGHTFAKGRILGSKNVSKTPLADLMKEVAGNKHYTIKGTGEKVVAYDLMAEKIVDRIVEKGDLKALEIFLERTEGKVTQGVKLSGGLSHGTPDDEEVARMTALFPDKK